VPRVLLERYDANHNGILDPDEWAKHKQDLEQLKAAKLAARNAGARPSAGMVSTNPPAKP
jgi:hypothetical protein